MATYVIGDIHNSIKKLGMYTCWIVDVVCKMGGSRVSVWKPEKDFIHKLTDGE